ncbi:MAG: YdcF family protein [Eubacteriales bacterium]|nr:YdcF family protein [Eubacteriales bacterium]MDY3332433.1 YdcF family protein [Gallibacter sp.]
MQKIKNVIYSILAIVFLVLFFVFATPILKGIINVGIVIPAIISIVIAVYSLLSLKHPISNIPNDNEITEEMLSQREEAKHFIQNRPAKLRSTVLFGAKKEKLEEFNNNYEYYNVPGLIFSKKTRKKLDKIFFTFVALLLIVATITSYILFFGYDRFDINTSSNSNKTVLVLGCKVNGNIPSRTLKNRLNASIEVLNANPTMKCIVSGGKGKNENITEAYAMQQYLIDKGIAQDRIFLEENSFSTKENIQNSYEIANKNNLPNEFIIVTDAYHQHRANRYAKENNVKAVGYPAHTEWYLLAPYTARESLGLIYESIFGSK